MNNEESILFKIFNFKKTSTNIDNLIGKVALVTKDINNLLSVGEVLVNHDYWSAINGDGDEIIKSGTKVEVLEIRGVKLIVKSLKEI